MEYFKCYNELFNNDNTFCQNAENITPVNEVPEAILDLRHSRAIDGLEVLKPFESLRHRMRHLDSRLSFSAICEIL